VLFYRSRLKNSTPQQVRVHLTGESHSMVPVAPCKNVPAACEDFSLAERERETAKLREKEASHTKIYNETTHFLQG
jgi:hypothetical protein